MCNKVFEEAAKRDRESKENNKEEETMENKKETLIVSPLSEVNKENDKPEKDEEFIEPNDTNDERVDEIPSDSMEDFDREDESSESQGDRLVIKPIGEDTTNENSESLKVSDPLKAIDGAIEESGIKDMLTDSEEEVVDNYINNSKIPESMSASQAKVIKVSDEESTAQMAVGVLQKFKDYITSDKFDKACEDAGKKYGVKKNIVKSKMISGFLGTIADTLGLTITIAGDIILGAVGFIATIIERIVEFTVDSLLKLVSVLTLNCGEVVNS